MLGTSVNAVHQALLLRRLTDDVTLFAHTMPEPDDDAWDQLAALGVRVVVGRVDRLDVRDDVLRAVRASTTVTLSGSTRWRSSRGSWRAASCTSSSAGCSPTTRTAPSCRPTRPGAPTCRAVWAAGNTRDLAAMVATAAGSGVLAGAALDADLVGEDARAAVRARAAGTQPAAGPGPAGYPWPDAFSRRPRRWSAASPPATGRAGCTPRPERPRPASCVRVGGRATARPAGAVGAGDLAGGDGEELCAGRCGSPQRRTALSPP